MTTNAQIGYGTLFQINDEDSSPPGGWTTVAEVVNVTPPNIARDAVDATHTESPDGYREFIPGLKDAGQVTVEMNFVPDSVTTELLLAQLNRNTLTQSRILFPDGAQTSPPTCSIWRFDAILTAFPPEAPIDGKMAATVTLKVSGKPIFTRATA